MVPADEFRRQRPRRRRSVGSDDVRAWARRFGRDRPGRDPLQLSLLELGLPCSRAAAVASASIPGTARGSIPTARTFGDCNDGVRYRRKERQRTGQPHCSGKWFQCGRAPGRRFGWSRGIGPVSDGDRPDRAGRSPRELNGGGRESALLPSRRRRAGQRACPSSTALKPAARPGSSGPQRVVETSRRTSGTTSSANRVSTSCCCA